MIKLKHLPGSDGVKINGHLSTFGNAGLNSDLVHKCVFLVDIEW